jgi:hypothetical protein
MSRLEMKCPEDCARCTLLTEGKVDMIPCVLDQIFTRVRRTEKSVEALAKKIDLQEGTMPLVNLAGSTDPNEEE